MSENKVMDFDAWILYGQQNNWCSTIVCDTHTGAPLSEAESEEFSDGFDPCVLIVRLYESPKEREEVLESRRDG
jgi:hypothetical protein